METRILHGSKKFEGILVRSLRGCFLWLFILIDPMVTEEKKLPDAGLKKITIELKIRNCLWFMSKNNIFIDKDFYILTNMYSVVCLRIIVCWKGLRGISHTVVNPIPPAVWRLCSSEHLKTLWQKENWLIYRNYSFLQWSF